MNKCMLFILFNFIFISFFASAEKNLDKSLSMGWKQSYKAGYTDNNGHYAGGSELLHIISHKGKLYAALGYWGG